MGKEVSGKKSPAVRPDPARVVAALREVAALRSDYAKFRLSLARDGVGEESNQKIGEDFLRDADQLNADAVWFQKNWEKK